MIFRDLLKVMLPLLMLLAVLGSCGDDDTGIPQGSISIGGVRIAIDSISEKENIDIRLENMQTGSVFTGKSNSQGIADFTVTPGIYKATASGSKSQEGIAYLYNGASGQIVVRAGQTASVVIAMRGVRRSQVVIKEIYNGGVMKNDGSGNFQFDKCIILYNNSPVPASLSNLCFGMAPPFNGHANNYNYDSEGHLTYEAEGFTPALNGIWWFPSTLTIEPYSQIVVNVCGAIDNTQTVSASVNYANSEYYCMYDPASGYSNTSYYPTPSDVIPSSHYLKAVRYGLGNAWALSVTSPAVFVFQTHGVEPADFATAADRQWYDGGSVSQTALCIKVPNEWIVDAVEVFGTSFRENSQKRFSADIDAGYALLTNQQGHTVYRNIDKLATDTLPENQGRLVYGYSLGVGSSTDPSGIDAEASIAAGAHIVYQDTNNSTADFHERQRCSLRD